ncbi:hypothetical protein SDC9_210221 [bioreactor metagenome]|uniref:Uncharacterized protein n=1 Tax=bioreactor metagenome TaxID=1076179 RepID=A0A645JGX2_9ZZZZ
MLELFGDALAGPRAGRAVAAAGGFQRVANRLIDQDAPRDPFDVLRLCVHHRAGDLQVAGDDLGRSADCGPGADEIGNRSQRDQRNNADQKRGDQEFIANPAPVKQRSQQAHDNALSYGSS